MFKKYPKIYRLGKKEVEGILDGTCYIQEKIDGANASIWLEDNEILCASRNKVLTPKENLRGFYDYVHNSEKIKALLDEYPEYRLFGEWLIPHSTKYDEGAYNHFYLFDIEVQDYFLRVDRVYEVAHAFNLRSPALWNKVDKPTLDFVKSYLCESILGPQGEGVVIKNDDFENCFGENCYAKLKIEKPKKTPKVKLNTEAKIAWRYVTPDRVKHQIDILKDTKDVSLSDIPRLVEMVYHDILTEDIYEIQKKHPEINFRKLRKFIGYEISEFLSKEL